VNQRLFKSCLCFFLLVSLVAVPVLAATITCPSSCSCLLPAEAKKMGYPGYCGGKQMICGYDSFKNEKYCYTKPVTTTTVPIPVTCPSGCSCYTLEDGKMNGYSLCGGKLTLCGYSANQQPKYCHQLPVTVTTTTPVPSSGTPDLVISDVYTEAWPSFREFRYIIQNRGDGVAGASTTRLFIDGVQIGEDAIAGLNPGEYRVESFPYSGTCTGSADMFGATADISGAVTESDETNNARQREYSCPASTVLPDIALLEIWHDGERNFTYSTRAYTPLENIRFRIRSSNTSGALSTEARLFIDGTWVSTTTATVPTTRVTGWEGQFGYTGICSGTSDTVRVVIDPSDSLIEQDESNNELSVTLPCSIIPTSGQLPDLVIRRYWTSLITDYTTKIGYEIKNQGKEYSPFTETGMFIDGDYRIQDGVDPLAPGESRDEEFWQNYSYRECSGTSDTIRLVADHDGRVTEMDETNNGYDSTMTCIDIPPPYTTKPDLVINSAWYECVPPCHEYNLSYTISNQGTGAAGASVTGLNINGHELGTSSAPALGSGAHSTLIFSTAWVPESRDNHVIVCADRNNNVDEITPAPSGELNNCFEADWEILPNCHDGRQNGGEEGVDCGGPCTSCDMVAISGRILYEEMTADRTASLGAFPARRIKFQMLGDDGDVTGLMTTNNDGSFYLVIPTRYRGESLKIRIGDCSNFRSGFNYAAKIARDYDGCNEYVKWTSNPFTVPETGDLYIGDRIINASVNGDFQFDIEHKGYDATYPCYTIWPCDDEQESGAGGSAYFSIADAALAGREYADEYRGGTDSIGKVSIQYPDEEWNMFYPPTYIIDIAGNNPGHWPDMGFDDGGVIHEYGHYLAYKISYLNPWGGDHSECTKKNSYFAWNEGWAEYFGTIVVHRDQITGASTTGSLNEPNFGYAHIENLTCGTDDGDEYEGNVAAILWDLADDPTTYTRSYDEPWDTVHYNERLTFRVFDNEFGGATGHAYIPTLCNFVNYGWDDYDEYRTDGEGEIDALLTHMNVDC
jgi:subtilase family serine protease